MIGRASNAHSRFIEPWHLAGVDPSLSMPLWSAALAFNEGAKDHGYFVKIHEGIRSELRQAELRASGKTNAVRSKHLYGLAVDVAIFNASKEYVADLSAYRLFADVLRGHDLSINGQRRIIWGGDWKSVDGVHFEL